MNKIKCDMCKEEHRKRNTIKIKGKNWCSHCRQKRKSCRSMTSAQTLGRFKIKLDEALLNKVYEVKDYNHYGSCQCVIHVPACLAFKKVKLVLVE